MDRVAGADESYLLAERLFGMAAPIQYAWIFPAEPDPAALAGFGDQLAAGLLSRKVVPAVVPFARHRWVRSPHPPVLRIEPEPVPDGEIGAWADRTLRTADLDPAAGRGWQLVGTHTVSGKFVLSLLISHMVTDGQGLYNAFAAAHAGTSMSGLPSEDEVRGWPRVRADLKDSRTALGEAASSARVIGTELWRQRKAAESGAKPVAAKAAPRSGTAESGSTLAIVDVDRNAWTAAATAAGGTGATLFTALLGGLVRRSGYPLAPDGLLKVCIAVSNREDGDDRANASGGVWIRVPGEIGPDAGLAEIRALSKQAFIEYRTRDDTLTENLQPVVRLLPKAVIRKLMRAVPGPDTTVSNLGAAPDSALEIGGQRAESFAIRAIMQGQSAAERRRQGPAIAAWAVEYDDKITLTFFGIDPDHFGDAEQLRKAIATELDSWGLAGTHW
ncbi:hypothetical protein [Nocardia sp. NPDC057227]|uniref:hypothetical protein n=1 Tax=Nocardia sp. NPDC057227 TaxID=3346056 RepID=UPI00363B544C